MGAIDEAEWDIYREIHKAARLVLCNAVTLAGAADATSDAEIDNVLRAVDELGFVLRGHHHHEHDFIDALVARHAPELNAVVDAGHVETAAQLDAIDALAATVAAAPAVTRNPLLHRLYLELATLTATYLHHLDIEEREVSPVLNAVLTRDELIALTEELRGSVPPPEMCRYMQSMLPAMNLVERADMLGGMRHAPAEIWDLFRNAATRALTPAEFAAVAAHIGTA